MKLDNLTLAVVSQDVYGERISFQRVKKADLEKIRSPKGLFRMTDVSKCVHPNEDFYAALYINFIQGKAEQAVIAFRGTMPSRIGNVIEDVVSWYSSAMGDGLHDHVPMYMSHARMFYTQAFQYLTKHFPALVCPSRLILTGHSLGGALAQLTALQHSNLRCVVFNSPVCRPFLDEPSLEKANIVTNINARYGVINKVGGIPVGKINVIDNPYMEAEAKSLFEHFGEQTYDAGTLESLAGDKLKVPILGAAGFAEHLAGLLKSVTGLTSLPKEHSEIEQCEAPEEYGMLSNLLAYSVGKAYCNLSEVLKVAPEAIIAQHDIANMIATLESSASGVGRHEVLG